MSDLRFTFGVAFALGCTSAEPPRSMEPPARPSPEPRTAEPPAPVQPPATPSHQPPTWSIVRDVLAMQRALDRAEAEGRPVLIHVAATWCLPCEELRRRLAVTEVARRVSERFAAIEVDVSEGSVDDERIQSALAAETLPNLLVYASDVDTAAEFRNALARGSPMVAPAARFELLPDEDALLAAIAKVR